MVAVFLFPLGAAFCLVLGSALLPIGSIVSHSIRRPSHNVRRFACTWPAGGLRPRRALAYRSRCFHKRRVYVDGLFDPAGDDRRGSRSKESALRWPSIPGRQTERGCSAPRSADLCSGFRLTWGVSGQSVCNRNILDLAHAVSADAARRSCSKVLRNLVGLRYARSEPIVLCFDDNVIVNAFGFPFENSSGDWAGYFERQYSVGYWQLRRPWRFVGAIGVGMTVQPSRYGKFFICGSLVFLAGVFCFALSPYFSTSL